MKHDFLFALQTLFTFFAPPRSGSSSGRRRAVGAKTLCGLRPAAKRSRGRFELSRGRQSSSREESEDNSRDRRTNHLHDLRRRRRPPLGLVDTLVDSPDLSPAGRLLLSARAPLQSISVRSGPVQSNPIHSTPVQSSADAGGARRDSSGSGGSKVAARNANSNVGAHSAARRPALGQSIGPDGGLSNFLSNARRER